MPPKADGAGKRGISNDEFLAACVKHSKDKFAVNFEALAQDIGMSTGGAQNKFRAIMKQFEDDGFGASKTNDTATNTAPAPKTPTKRKAATTKARKTVTTDEDTNGVKSEEEENDVEASPAKKAKIVRKKPAGKSGVKKVAKPKIVKEETPEEQEDTDEDEQEVKEEDEADVDDATGNGTADGDTEDDGEDNSGGDMSVTGDK